MKQYFNIFEPLVISLILSYRKHKPQFLKMLNSNLQINNIKNCNRILKTYFYGEYSLLVEINKSYDFILYDPGLETIPLLNQLLPTVRSNHWTVQSYPSPLSIQVRTVYITSIWMKFIHGRWFNIWQTTLAKRIWGHVQNSKNLEGPSWWRSG